MDKSLIGKRRYGTTNHPIGGISYRFTIWHNNQREAYDILDSILEEFMKVKSRL